jgi:hypothetical protein
MELATPLTRFIGLVPLRLMHARPTHRPPPLLSAKARGSWKSGVAPLNQIKRMGWFGQGQNSQGTLCPRVATSKNFGRGHIGRGWTNIAPFYAIFFLKVRGFFENVVGGGGGGGVRNGIEKILQYSNGKIYEM